MVNPQTALFDSGPATPAPVNVASVPQRSPFRYPGGKTWFAPRLREWLANQKRKPEILIEPFAGGGILAAGAGLVKNGEAGKGVLSRWYPATLAKRLRAIDRVKEKMRFEQGDGLELLARCRDARAAVFFIDPPYTAGGKKAGSRLYTHHQLNHEVLFEACAGLKGDFIMTYDDATEVRKLARRHGFQAKPVAMKNTHHAELTELVIGRDLSWMSTFRQAP